MKYENEGEILTVVKSFENGTIRREDWRHAEHLTMALFYLFQHDFETALEKMRKGIFNLLRSFDLDLTKEMPYHETLTIFWMRTIFDFKNSKTNDSFLTVCNELVETFDKDYPLKFYSRELLFSDAARQNFVAADL